MIILNAVTKSLEIILDAAVATNELAFVCSYEDMGD